MRLRERWIDHFLGGATSFSTSASAFTPWRATITAASGTPIYTVGLDNGSSGGSAGIARLGFTSNTQVENICLSFGDVLTWDIDDRPVFTTRVKMGQSSVDSATSFAFGFTGDRNDAIDSIAYQVLFRVIGSDSTTLVVVESDDGTTDNDDKATQLTLTAGWKTFVIDAKDKSNVIFSMTDNTGVVTRVAPGTTFDLSDYAGSLQPFYQLQKTSDNNTDYVDIDFCSVEWDVVS